jgi:hypothetical protein
LSERAEPSRAKLITWLRVNLGLTLFLTGALSGTVTTLITATLAYGDFLHHRNDQDAQIAEIKAKVEGDATTKGLLNDMIDVDRRFREAAANLAEMRRIRDQQLAEQRQRDSDTDADLRSRLNLLEAQAKWTIDRTPTPQPLGAKR